jgi:hypothetical protein
LHEATFEAYCKELLNILKFHITIWKSPSKSNVCRIVALHKRMCSIDGCLCSLDVTKFHGDACPSGLKSQFEGERGISYNQAGGHGRP